MGTGWATIANVTGRGLTVAICAVRVATRTVNGDGCYEVLSLKSTHHTASTDQRHHPIKVESPSLCSS
ncbi:hypothetical protein [Photorhabdus temperata]|uniref:hypothetical protein n=1 Tax=Photorhabdus temperata TaxID=574560 RepID=UPI0036F3F36E